MSEQDKNFNIRATAEILCQGKECELCKNFRAAKYGTEEDLSLAKQVIEKYGEK